MTAHPITPRERQVARAAYAQALVDGQFCDAQQAVFRASVAYPELTREPECEDHGRDAQPARLRGSHP